MITAYTGRSFPSDMLLGAKMQTLFACYREFPGAASFWESESALLCFFSGRLTVCGKIDFDELLSFAAFLGAREIEGGAALLPSLPGFRRTEHPLLFFSDAAAAAPVCETDDLAEIWQILCAADANFALQSDRLEWLSDLRRRIRLGYASAYCENGAAVLVTARSSREAVLGAVACRPEAQGRHAAAALVRKVCARLIAEGRKPVTAAAAFSLAEYYERIGFTRRGSLALLTQERHP